MINKRQDEDLEIVCYMQMHLKELRSFLKRESVYLNVVWQQLLELKMTIHKDMK